MGTLKTKLIFQPVKLHTCSRILEHREKETNKNHKQSSRALAPSIGCVLIYFPLCVFYIAEITVLKSLYVLLSPCVKKLLILKQGLSLNTSIHLFAGTTNLTALYKSYTILWARLAQSYTIL